MLHSFRAFDPVHRSGAFQRSRLVHRRLVQIRWTVTVQGSRCRVSSVSLFVFCWSLAVTGSWRKANDEICDMSKPVVEVQVRAVAAVSGGCAVFLGNEDKVFVMFVDQSVGAAITMFMQGTQKERPLTHDLLANVLRALGAKIDRVVVNDLKDGTYFAKLVLSAENETQQKKIIEIDARPSDCIAMATQQLAPIFVSLDVWDEVEDMTEVLRKMQQEGSDTEQSDEEEES